MQIRLNSIRNIFLTVAAVAIIARVIIYCLVMNSPLRYYSGIVGLDMQVFMVLGEKLYNGKCQFSIYRGLAALCHLLNGDKPWPTLLIAIQMLLGTGTAVLTAYISLRLSGHKTIAFIAGLLSALYAPELVYESVTLRESTYLFLTCLSMASLLKWRTKQKKRWLIMAGICAMFPVFSRFAAILWTITGLAWIKLVKRKKSGWKSIPAASGLFLVGCCLPVIIVILFNQINCRNPNPFLISIKHLRLQAGITARQQIDQLNPVNTKEHDCSHTPTFIEDIPRRLKRSAGYFTDIFKPYEICNNINYYFIREVIPAYKFFPGPALVIPFAVTGLLILLLSGNLCRRESLLLFYIVAFCLPIALFVPLGRYRLVMLPVFCYSSAWLVYRLYILIKANNSKAFYKVAGILLLFTIIRFVTAPGHVPVRAADFITVGKATELKDGKISPEAMSYYNRALVVDPGSVAAMINLGRGMLAMGKFSEAAALTGKAWSQGETGFESSLLYASSLLGAGKPAEAEKILSSLSEPEEDKAKLTYYFNLGESQRLSGKPAKAIESYHKALKYTSAPNMRKVIEIRLRSAQSQLSSAKQ